MTTAVRTGEGLILSASFEEAAFDAAIAGGCTGAYLWTSALSDAVRIAAGITEGSKGSRPSRRGILASVRAPRPRRLRAMD